MVVSLGVLWGFAILAGSSSLYSLTQVLLLLAISWGS